MNCSYCPWLYFNANRYQQQVTCCPGFGGLKTKPSYAYSYEQNYRGPLDIEFVQDPIKCDSGPDHEVASNNIKSCVLAFLLLRIKKLKASFYLYFFFLSHMSSPGLRSNHCPTLWLLHISLIYFYSIDQYVINGQYKLYALC